jgi:hypothetical protein
MEVLLHLVLKPCGEVYVLHLIQKPCGHVEVLNQEQCQYLIHYS